MLDISRVKAITIDLDDTLWPVWPVIERAERILTEWLAQKAPATAAMFSTTASLRGARMFIEETRPELRHDLSAMRRESIRHCLTEAGDDPSLAEAAFDVFFEQRHVVELFDDAADGLARMAARYPLVALSNGNANITTIGIGHHFAGAVSAYKFGIGKPDRRIFQAAATAAGVEMHDVLHVGDDMELDVIGALDAGMQAAWIDRDEREWSHEKVPSVTVSSLADLCDILNLPAIPMK